MTMTKEYILQERGWYKVPVGNETGWSFHIGFLPNDPCFTLDAAFELETIGVGILAYATHQALQNMTNERDQHNMMVAGEEQFLAGIHQGSYPNF